MSGDLPLPLNSCSITVRDPQSTNPKGRLQFDARLHPTGGLTESCGGDCGDTGLGLAVNLCGDDGTREDAPAGSITDANGNTVNVEYVNPLKLSTTGCLWFDTSAIAGARHKTKVGAQVAQPAALGIGATVPVGSATTINLKNDGLGDVCYEPSVRICNAFIDCPTGAPVTLDVPAQTITTADGGGQVEVPAQTIETPPQTKASVAQRVTVNGQTCEFMAAGTGDYGAYSGTITLDEITVASGATLTFDVLFDLIGKGEIANQFTASTGSVCIVLEEIPCSEVNC